MFCVRDLGAAQMELHIQRRASGKDSYVALLTLEYMLV